MKEDTVRLKALVRKFRILRGWTIRWDRRGPEYGKAFIDARRRKAWICIWDPKGGPEPSDFMLHEVLHCAFVALLSLDKRSSKELQLAEEALVQDICAVSITDGASITRR